MIQKGVYPLYMYFGTAVIDPFLPLFTPPKRIYYEEQPRSRPFCMKKIKTAAFDPSKCRY